MTSSTDKTSDRVIAEVKIFWENDEESLISPLVLPTSLAETKKRGRDDGDVVVADADAPKRARKAAGGKSTDTSGAAHSEEPESAPPPPPIALSKQLQELLKGREVGGTFAKDPSLLAINLTPRKTRRGGASKTEKDSCQVQDSNLRPEHRPMTDSDHSCGDEEEEERPKRGKGRPKKTAAAAAAPKKTAPKKEKGGKSESNLQPVAKEDVVPDHSAIASEQEDNKEEEKVQAVVPESREARRLAKGRVVGATLDKNSSDLERVALTPRKTRNQKKDSQPAAESNPRPDDPMTSVFPALLPNRKGPEFHLMIESMEWGGGGARLERGVFVELHTGPILKVVGIQISASKRKQFYSNMDSLFKQNLKIEGAETQKISGKTAKLLTSEKQKSQVVLPDWECVNFDAVEIGEMKDVQIHGQYYFRTDSCPQRDGAFFKDVHRGNEVFETKDESQWLPLSAVRNTCAVVHVHSNSVGAIFDAKEKKEFHTAFVRACDAAPTHVYFARYRYDLDDKTRVLLSFVPPTHPLSPSPEAELCRLVAPAPAPRAVGKARGATRRGVGGVTNSANSDSETPTTVLDGISLKAPPFVWNDRFLKGLDDPHWCRCFKSGGGGGAEQTPTTSGGAGSAEKTPTVGGASGGAGEQTLRAVLEGVAKSAFGPKQSDPQKQPSVDGVDGVGKGGAAARREDKEPSTSTACDDGDGDGAVDFERVYNEARDHLQIYSVPVEMPCRDAEKLMIQQQIEGCIHKGQGGLLYISGMPGTGKTATVNEVIKSMQSKLECNALAPFQHVEINCMQLKTAEDIYGRILECIRTKPSQRKVPKKNHLQAIDRYFSTHDSDRPYCVLVVDEFDMLAKRNSQIIYNLGDWPALPNSKLFVIGIANTMNLVEQFASKMTSRFGATNRMTFASYKPDQIEKIMHARLQGVTLFDQKAISLMAKKVSSTTSDLRIGLEICKRAADISENEFREKLEQSSSSGSGGTSQQGASTSSEPPPPAAPPVARPTVTMQHVAAAMQAIFDQTSIKIMKDMPQQFQIFMFTVARVATGEGSHEIEVPLQNVFRYHCSLCRHLGLPYIPTWDSMTKICKNLTDMALLVTEGEYPTHCSPLCGTVKAIDPFSKTKLGVDVEDIRLALENERTGIGKYLFENFWLAQDL